MDRYVVPQADVGSRIDAVMARELGLSRGRVQHLLKNGIILCREKAARSSQALKLDDVIDIVGPLEAAVVDVLPPVLEIIYQDDDVVVINKEAGIAVHPGSGKRLPTIADGMKSLTSDPDPERPGIVHRLDRDTSGVMIMARNSKAKTWLMKQFHDRLVQKEYTALVTGHPQPTEAIINLPLARSINDPLRRSPSALGKPAETRYRVIEEFEGYSLVECYPLTGRTHQIRAHFTALGHPIAGDRRYGALLNEPRGLKRQFLHAASLALTLPNGDQKTFTAPLPKDLERILKTLRKSV